MATHIRAAWTRSHLAIPIGSGRLIRGQWQAICRVEHRTSPHRRELALHVIGAPD
jgi:thiamine phosphate synthase YjbQ (UPF0047 family)